MTVLRVDTIAGIGQTFGPLLDGDLEFNSQNYIVLPKGSSNQQGVLRTTEDVIGVGGTYYDNLVLAMPFNEATGLRDVSSRNRNPGTYGNVAISTAQSKYYGSSAYFDGTGDYLNLNVGVSSDFVNWWTSDFTVEAWIYADSYADWDAGGDAGNRIPSMIGNMNYSDDANYWSFGPIISNRVEFYYWKGSQNHTFITTNTLSTGVWSHIAMSYKFGTGAKLFINGVGTDYIALSGTPQSSTSSPILVGGYNNNSITGYIQDLRIYKGIAKYTANFTPPERIAETGVGFKTGALRYNTDSNKPELYDGNQWTELQISNVGLGTAGDTGPGARGVWGGGSNAPGAVTTIDYINISSGGTAQPFGDLPTARRGNAAFSSSTRGVFAGGYNPNTNEMKYITFSSTGTVQTFGTLSGNRGIMPGLSNSTRGMVAGGYVSSNFDIIEYVTIASTGNMVDFNDLITAKRAAAACASPTRGVIVGGVEASIVNTIEFITISTLGKAQDFGDLPEVGRFDSNGCSNATRGLVGGGHPGTATNRIEYLTIATTGNAQNFGDLSQVRFQCSPVSSPTRGVFGGGENGASPSPSFYTTVDYVTILTEGNAVDFGDLTVARSFFNSCSNAHGGL